MKKKIERSDFATFEHRVKAHTRAQKVYKLRSRKIPK